MFKSNFSVIFNILSALYFAFLSPIILKISVVTVKSERVFLPWFGVSLIIISVLEIYAFPKKIKYVRKAVKDRGGKFINGIILWLFHTLISIGIVLAIFKSFGMNTTKPDIFMSLLLFVVIIKELVLLFFMMIDYEDVTLEKFKRPNNKEWIIDVILFAYACLAYTVTWQTIASDINMQKQNTGMYLLNILIASLMFLIFYMPVRIPYFLEEVSQLKTGKDILKYIFSILLVLISVIFSL